MSAQYFCPNETRKNLVRADGTLNGVDYLEVLDDEAPVGTSKQQTLLVHCLLPVVALGKNNVRIDGGVRVTPVNVVWAHAASNVPAGLLTVAEQNFLDDRFPTVPARQRVLVVRTDARGDFSTYTLRLVSPIQPDDPPTGFDRLLASVAFSFKVECKSDFDCKTETVCSDPILTAPQINYLAKDYLSFRQLMLDRLAVIMPDWRERNPADLGIALVELLAYGGDYLSYYQDAAATEAYLGTARRRTSIRRHARLVDYFVHDGMNARAWICFEVDEGGGADGMPLLASTVVTTADGAVAFETLHALTLNAKRSRIQFYTWGDPRCCLPKGATTATLHGSAADLELGEGDVLVFEEALGPERGLAADADPSHRHVVRLNRKPVERTDPLNNEKVLEISWHAADALPFPLCLWLFDDKNNPGNVKQASIARGNVVLADHGLTIKDEALVPATVPAGRRYRPHLVRAGLTHAAAYDHLQARRSAAFAATQIDSRRVLPQVRLNGDGEIWLPQRDLLNSDRFAPEFVVEMENDGRAHLRFGDDVLGRAPSAAASFNATYRIGNGRGGNVGADTLTRLDIGGVKARNPLPAVGGLDPEPNEQVRLYAPQAFRSQERAVTEADYAAAAQRHPDVQRAAATRRWTGSWYTIFITVDRRGGRPVDAEFETELRAFLERFRMAGYDLEIDAPRFVPLDIQLSVCVKPNYFRSNVKQALLATFSNRDLPDGRRGFFHPDNFTFGQPVYLSRIIAAVMQTPGVDWVKPLTFQRYGQPARNELQDELITFERLEIARLDNDPNAQEKGRLIFDMKGGL